MPRHLPVFVRFFADFFEQVWAPPRPGFRLRSRTRAWQSHPVNTAASLADHGPSSGIASSYPVECMPRRPFPRYVACGTDTRQRRPSALSCCRPRTRVDLRRRREHADRVRNVAVCCPVGLVPPASCAASTLSTGVLTQHAAPTMAWTCSFAEQMTGMRQVV